MYVDKVEWISRAGQEAELHLSSGEHMCMAFCQPCEYLAGTLITGPLHAFMTKNVILSSAKEVSLKRIATRSLAHGCTARVVDPQQALLSIGGFMIELDDNIPGGINTGDLVDFQCARLDVW